jgi:hypothetical protein
VALGIGKGQPERSVNATQLEPESYAGVSDVPPVTSCARCGLTTCEGCTPPETPAQARGTGRLPWTERTSVRDLLETALRTSTEVRVVFAGLPDETPGRALSFALAVELLALGSFLGAAGVGLLLVAPRFVLGLSRQGGVLLWTSGLLLLSAVGVVALHLLWAELLERGLHRAGQVRNRRLAIAFAGYSCGWDLLTSPLGLWLSVRSGAGRGHSRMQALLSALRAPRPAMQAYLVERRGLDEAAANKVIRGAARDAFLLVGLTVLLVVGIILGLLAALWPY